MTQERSYVFEALHEDRLHSFIQEAALQEIMLTGKRRLKESSCE